MTNEPIGKKQLEKVMKKMNVGQSVEILTEIREVLIANRENLAQVVPGIVTTFDRVVTLENNIKKQNTYLAQLLHEVCRAQKISFNPDIPMWELPPKEHINMKME